MQRLQHNLASGGATHSAPPRFLGLGFTALLNIALIAALASGLTLHFVPKIPPETQARVIQPPNVDHPVIPPTPKGAKPRGVVVPEPFFDFAYTNPGTPIAVTTTGTSTPLAISGMHTIPEYPPLSRAAGEKGAVQLLIMIDANGNVSNATVARSSGYQRLDEAAVSWVKAHWRYRPAVRDGIPVAAQTDATIIFKLN